MINFEGAVASGRGRACGHIAQSLKEIERLTGVRIYPGSLNVVLDNGIKLRATCSRQFDDGKRFLWPASIAGVPVWLYRWQGTPFHIVEVLSDRRLREVLNVHDGSRIKISVFESSVEEMCLRERLSFLAIWGFGRGRLYYKNTYASNRIVFLARKCMRDGQRGAKGGENKRVGQ